MDSNKIIVISVASMASVSASIMASYITMLPAQYVLGAMALNALSSLIIGIMIAPDVEKDTEKVDIKDATEIQKYCVELVSFNALQLSLADFNKDGSVTVSDATEIQRFAVL